MSGRCLQTGRGLVLSAFGLAASCGWAEGATTIGNDVLRLTFDERTAAFDVTDVRSGRTWPSLDVGAGVWTRIAELSVASTGTSLSFVGETSNVVSRVRVDLSLSNEVLRVALAASPTARMAGPLAYPYAFADRRGDRNLLPYGAGYAFPAEQLEMGARFDPRMTCYSREFKMGLFGVYAERIAANGEVVPAEGYMAVIETPCNVIGTYAAASNGLRQFSVVWDQDMRTWGHDRVVRFEFLDRGGPAEIARRYRQEMKRRGYLRTFAEKAARHRAMRSQYERIARAPSVWYWAIEGGKAEVCRALRSACGFREFLFQFASRKDLGTWVTPEESAACARAAPDVLLSEYDIYKDTMERKNLPLIAYVRPYWSLEAADNDDIVYDAEQRPVRGWPVALKGDFDGHGKGLGCAAICEKTACAYARKRIAAELRRHPSYNARYLDVSGMCLGECWHPRHRVNRRESLECRRALLRMVTDEFGLLTSSEDGVECFVPECDYLACGFSAPDAYRVDGGRWMWKVYEGEPPDEICRGTDERSRIPLWELVFHDCTVTYWDWCDYNNKFPRIWWKRDLFNAVCGTPPLYFFNEESWKRFKPQLKASMAVACAGARATAWSAMTDYRILTRDRSVQQSVWSNGMRITVNFGSSPFAMEDGFTLAPRGMRLEP